MSDYDFTGNFSAAPLGPFTAENKALVWPPGQWSIYDPDPSGKYFELVDDARLGGRCCRMRYPAGAWGMGQQFYQVRIKSPQTVANLEFDFLFEENFDLAPPNAEKLGGGKIGPCINWGEVGGVTELRGTRAMIWYNGNGSNYQNTKFSPSCQDQRSGDQLIQPVKYSSPIELERIYHWRVQIQGGPNGFAKYWLDREPLATSIEGQALQVSEGDDVLFDFAFFAGGGQVQACRWDSFARHGNIRCWSGEAAEGGGESGSETPTPPSPDSDSGLRVTVGGVTYRASGALTLDPIE
jgi:hypothetical protein